MRFYGPKFAWEIAHSPEATDNGLSELGASMRSFFLGVARIAAVIVVVIVVLSGIGIGGFVVVGHWQEARETARNAPLEVLKKWPSITVEALGGVTLTLSTKWRERRLLYQFQVVGYPPIISAAMDDPSAESKWNLVFSDKDGFNVAKVEVPIHAMTRSTNGVILQATGLFANANTYMDAEDYRRAASWEISWFGFAAPKVPVPVKEPVAGAVPKQTPPVARPEPDVPKWKDIALWRKLDRKMSKQQVRQLLGEPTRIEEGGVLVFWYYDDPSIKWPGSGGSISFYAQAGSIYSFQEPTPAK